MRPANAPRYERGAGGHVESYFLRANDPERPRAIWLKATILACPGSDPIAEAWCIWFDGEKKQSWARRSTTPLHAARFLDGESTGIRIEDCAFELGPSGAASGHLGGPGDECRWTLTWTREEGAIAQPLSIYPREEMLEGPFPKSKLLTPYPALRFRGSVDCLGDHVDLDGWRGMQGHNWGRDHAWEYAWGQCLFAGGGQDPDGMVEGFTARIRMAGRTTPQLSALVVRRGAETFQFNRIFDVWNQDATVTDRIWTLAMEGHDGVAKLSMNASDRPMVCLSYRNPDGRLSYCFNSKLAETTLQVNLKSGRSFEYRSPFGGALEFLRNEPDEALPQVV